jgi:hypothetical protein
MQTSLKIRTFFARLVSIRLAILRDLVVILKPLSSRDYECCLDKWECSYRINWSAPPWGYSPTFPFSSIYTWGNIIDGGVS